MKLSTQKGSLRLPDNCIPEAKRKRKETMVALHKSGKLSEVYQWLCVKLDALDADISSEGEYWLDSHRISNNHLYLLFKKPAIEDGFDYADDILKRIITMGLDYIREQAIAHCTPGERISIRIPQVTSL